MLDAIAHAAVLPPGTLTRLMRERERTPWLRQYERDFLASCAIDRQEVHALALGEIQAWPRIAFRELILCGAESLAKSAIFGAARRAARAAVEGLDA